jgi:hypothetical protein
MVPANSFNIRLQALSQIFNVDFTQLG